MCVASILECRLSRLCDPRRWIRDGFDKVNHIFPQVLGQREPFYALQPRSTIRKRLQSEEIEQEIVGGVAHGVGRALEVARQDGLLGKVARKEDAGDEVKAAQK